MIVLHYIDKFDTTTKSESEFISVLCTGMDHGVESHIVTRTYKPDRSYEGLKVHVISGKNTSLKILYDVMPDIVHVHGCWSYHTAAFLFTADRRGFYTVLSPLGGLQPWVIKKKFWKRILPKIIGYQYLAVHRAGVIHATGMMEQENIKHLHWNKKVEIVKNALVTHETTIGQMCTDMASIYQKMIDDHIGKEINISTQQAFYTLVKAGLSYDINVLRPGISVISETEKNNFTLLKHNDWRFLSIFAQKEEMTQTVVRGMSVLDMENETGMQGGTTIIPSHKNTDDIINCLHLLKKSIWKRRLKIKDFSDLYTILRYNDYDEDELYTKLKEHHLRKLLSRLEYILVEMTGIEEGFLPLSPKNDCVTRYIKNMTKNN